MHRRRHVIGHIVGQLQAHFGIVLGQVHPLRAADRDHLAHQVEQEGAGLGIFTDRADGLADRRRGPRQAHQKNILLPNFAQDVRGQLGLDPAGDTRRQKRLPPRRLGAIELAKQQPLHRPGLADDTRAVNGRRNVGHPAHDVRRVINRSQILVFQYTVLKRDDRRAGTHQRANLAQRRLGVPQLDAQQHDIDDADRARIVGRADLGQVHGLGPFDTQALAAHRLQVFSSGHEVHLGAAAG